MSEENTQKRLVEPEEIFQEWYNLHILYKKNVIPRKIKNWDNIKTKDTWSYFSRLAEIINNNNGMIDYKLYILELMKYFKGQCNPKIFCTLKGIKLYKMLISKYNTTSEPSEIYEGILKSIRFIIQYCKTNNIKTFEDYLYYNQYIIPIILIHVNAGSITYNFLTIIKDIKHILNSFPQDSVDQFLSSFLDNFDKIRQKTISIQKVCKIELNLGYIINTQIDKN